jgi:hypothetical protein
MKKCSKCNTEKELVAFSKHIRSKDGLRSWCRNCSKQYREANKSRQAEQIRAWKLKNKYGITEDKAALLLELQKGLCGICSSDISEKPHIDHNHVTNEVRGLLCGSCNRALGLLKDSPAVLLNAYQYLIQKGHYGTGEI